MPHTERPAALGTRPAKNHLRKSYRQTLPRYARCNKGSWHDDFQSPIHIWRAEIADRFCRKHSGRLIFSANRHVRSFLWWDCAGWRRDDERVRVTIQKMISDDAARRSARRLGVSEFARGSAATTNCIVALVAADRRIRA